MLPDIVQSGGGSLWGATALLVTTVALSPILLLIGAYSAEARAQRLLDCVSHPVWVLSSFAVCEAILIYMERSPKLEQLGLVSERLSESDGFVASLVVAMFSAIIMVDCVLFLLWPQMLRTNRSVLCGMTINCIACSSYVLKFMQGEISMGDISGQRLSLTRYIVWNHTISLMCVLLNTLTRVTPQQACARVFLAFLTIEAGFAGSVDIGCISVSILLIAISQFALTRLCVLLFYSLRDSSSFAWQRSVVGMFVFTTWHIFPVIWLVVALSVVDASIEFPLYSIADVLSKVLITTTMLQGHVKVASDKLVDDFTHVQAERQVMEDDLHEMIASAAVPIIVTNSLGQITVWNRQVADRSRVKPEAAQGQPLWALDLLTPASADGCRHALEEILRPPSGDATTARTSVSFELRFEHHSQGVSSTSEPTTNSGSDGQHALEQNGGACAAGKGVNGRRSSSPNMTPSGKNGGGGGSGGRGNTTLLLVTASVTRNAEGRTVGLVCLCADMTAEVERLMAEASRAQIEAVNDAKDKFLACMSHEMRTPLSALIGLLQLINLKPTAEWNHAMLAPFIRSSLRSAEHLCVLVSDVLDMSKVQQGRLSLDYKELDLKEMVDAVHGRCRHVLSAIESRERQIELIVTIEPEPSASNGGSCLRVLRGDEQRIQQVMTNLGTNAIKYTLQGSVSLHVSVLPLDPSKAAELGLDQEAAHYAPRCAQLPNCPEGPPLSSFSSFHPRAPPDAPARRAARPTRVTRRARAPLLAGRACPSSCACACATRASASRRTRSRGSLSCLRLRWETRPFRTEARVSRARAASGWPYARSWSTRWGARSPSSPPSARAPPSPSSSPHSCAHARRAAGRPSAHGVLRSARLPVLWPDQPLASARASRGCHAVPYGGCSPEQHAACALASLAGVYPDPCSPLSRLPACRACCVPYTGLL